MLRVLSIFGTRPEAIKMAPVIRALQAFPDEIESRVCVTAQHREMLDQVLEMFDILPDVDLDLMEPDQAMTTVAARALSGLADVLRKLRPDVVLVQGDTTSAMAAALCAFHERCAVGHVEAGLRSGNRCRPFPEEINRRLITVLSQHHFAPTRNAADALGLEGVPAADIVVTGNTVIDAFLWMLERPASPDTLRLFDRIGSAADDKLVLVTAHRRENLGPPLENICNATLDLVSRNPEVRIVWPVHPNPGASGIVRRLLGEADRICLIDPLPYDSFVHLINRAYLILTDSGGIQEEAPSVGKPVLVLRTETERPEAVAAGTTKVVGVARAEIVSEVEHLLKDELAYSGMARAVNPYGDGQAGRRVVESLLSREAVARQKCLST